MFESVLNEHGLRSELLPAEQELIDEYRSIHGLKPIGDSLEHVYQLTEEESKLAVELRQEIGARADDPTDPVSGLVLGRSLDPQSANLRPFDRWLPFAVKAG